MNIKQSLTENLGVKLIALVVAMFIWFNASGQQTVVRVLSVPLELENLPDSLVVTAQAPDRVEISIGGTKRQLITMGFRRGPSVVLDLTGTLPGRQRVSLTPLNVRLPGGLDRRNVRVISPTLADISVEPLVTRRVQVTLNTTGAIPENFVLMDGAISLEPAWTSVRGPASVVERIRSVGTVPLDLSKVNESGDRTMQLDFNPEQITCDPAEVTVYVRVNQKSRRVLTNVPPTVLVDSEDLTARVEPSTLTLTLEGPSSVVDTLSSGDVSILLNMSGKPASRYRLVPEIILPPGVTVVEISADTLEVSVIAVPPIGSP